MARIKTEVVYEFEIEKSRFICYLQRAFSEQEAKDYILSIKKMHPKANHACSAFIMGEHNEMQRSNDDGEPSGTAGVPMLESLKMNEMNDTVAVVVRYFGGIKLGAGGLIRAYSKSVSEAIHSAQLMNKCLTKHYLVTFTYDLIGKLDYYFLQNKIEVIDKAYDVNVTYQIRTTNFQIEEALIELCNGKIDVEYLEDEIVELPID